MATQPSYPTLAEFERFTPGELSDFITSELNNGNVAERLLEERISGEFLLLLKDEDVTQMFTVMGDRMFVKKLIHHYKPPSITEASTHSQHIGHSSTSRVTVSTHTDNFMHAFVVGSG